MKQLAKREKITIGIGGALVALVIGWKVMSGTPSTTADAATIPGAIQPIEELDRLHKTVAGLSKDTHTKIPAVETIDQAAAIRQDLTKQAQQAGVQVASVVGVETGGAVQPGAAAASAAAARPIQLRLDVSGKFDSFMKFIYALEQSEYPYTVREVAFDTAAQGGGGGGGSPGGGPRGGGGGGPSNGNVHVSMKVQSYLFPKVVVAPAPKPTEGASDRGGRGARGGATSPAMPGGAAIQSQGMPANIGGANSPGMVPAPAPGVGAGNVQIAPAGAPVTEFKSGWTATNINSQGSIVTGDPTSVPPPESMTTADQPSGGGRRGGRRGAGNQENQ